MNKAPYLLICLALLTSALTSANPAHADKTSAAYVAAIERGDAEAAYRAQSFIAPPYAYDLNPWHGVTFTKAINGRVVTPSYPFTYQDMTHLKVRKLYDRAGIAAMAKASSSELELIGKISDWANQQWGHCQPLPYPTWDANEILDKIESGDAFWCTFKAALLVQACNSAGLTARMIGINQKHNSAHTVTEVYNNELRKWMLVDVWYNCYFERDGVPLSVLEFHNSIDDTKGDDTKDITLVFGKNGAGLEYWDHKTGKADTIPHANKRVPLDATPNSSGDPGSSNYHYTKYYHDLRIVMRNDHTVHPQSKENVYVEGFMVQFNARGGEYWGPQLKWADDTTMPQITAQNTGEINDFEWPLNEVKVDLKKISVTGEPVVLEATLATLTPCFDRYQLEIDGRAVEIDDDVYIWKLKNGKNTLKVSSVNTVGRSGFASEFALDYDPALVDYSKPITVELKNAGMENFSDETKLLPASWSFITSNSLRYGKFKIDSQTKHSGKYSLVAKPAVDAETGIEYAFIVKSENFDVNPSKDVIYSIWMKSADEGTPVDIALLDCTYKGQGTYVKRVTVGRQWQQYNLKCRLHNEITQAYVGFKVYTGTIWADDAEFVEMD